MTAEQRTPLAILWSLLAVIFFSDVAQASPRPAWWADAQAQASNDGYVLVDDGEMEALRREGRALLMDVRPDYEFAMGHVPNAINMEFHLGDQHELPMSRAKRLAELLGPDHGRTIVIYCRSFM
ncbi:Rhodanese-related sulfurtransferase [Desulfocurvibacter africanus PCS]|uniref:Rhodanese-related sulfurtransferase n=2 Tax=Desulfocurvibacter africanus TaxID=873 RepID=M5PPE2_DESAF|nr:rhodanese-like domain-containing protein [Desulfocurvibacter africanus]EMG35849.1 Rhodanese-related sulfurtransferase [Desulfocurvibacter africanus PCS]